MKEGVAYGVFLNSIKIFATPSFLKKQRMDLNKLLIAISILLLFVGCGSDEDPIKYNVTGLWTGIRVYNNPASGTKEQYLNINLYENGTGDLEYESPVSYAKAYFQYEISGMQIICRGAYANTYGDIDENFSLTMRISGNSLIPDGRYNAFVLTRKGGDPIISGGPQENYSNNLKKVWVGTDNELILNFDSQTMELYAINSEGKYTYFNSDKFDYEPDRQEIVLDDELWNIKECTTSKLVLNKDGRTFSFNAGTSASIPKQPSFKEYLPVLMHLNSTDAAHKYSFYFETGNKLIYYEDSGLYVSSSIVSFTSKAILIAEGTWEYSSRENELICYFDSPTWHGSELETNKNLFPGWEPKKSCIKYIKLQAITPLIFNVTLPNGLTYEMK